MSRSKLPPEEIRALITLFEKGEKPLVISSRTGLSLKTVYNYGHAWEEGALVEHTEVLRPDVVSLSTPETEPSETRDVRLNVTHGGRLEAVDTAPPEEPPVDTSEAVEPPADVSTPAPEDETAPDAPETPPEVPSPAWDRLGEEIRRTMADQRNHDRQVENAVIRAVAWELELLTRHWRKHHLDLPPDITHELAMLRERIEGMTEIEEAMPPA